MLVVGGGGYKIRNVSRCWAFETSLLTQQQIPDEIPFHGKFFCSSFLLTLDQIYLNYWYSNVHCTVLNLCVTVYLFDAIRSSHFCQ